MSRGFAFSHVLLCKIFNVHCGSTSEIFSVARKGRKQVSTCGHKFSMLEKLLSTQSSLLGSAFPKPCSSFAPLVRMRRVALHSPLHPGAGIYHFHRRSNMAEMKSPNVHAKKNRNDTPRKRKTHIIKVRVTAEEKLRIAYACKELHLTQSELVRRVLYGVNVKHTVVVRIHWRRLPPCLPSAARWAATSTSLHGTSTPAAKTPSSSGRKFWRNCPHSRTFG